MIIEQNEELTRMIAEQELNIAARNDRINCMNLVPSTQACDVTSYSHSITEGNNTHEERRT